MSAPLAATALEALHCVLIHSRSAEDIALLPLLRTAARRGDGTGTFVELGASDGESGSQTFLVERCFGWRGVLIEANPWSYAQIADKQRSRAVTFHSGVCSLSDKQEVGYIDMYSGNGSVTGNPATMDKRFRAQWSHVLGNVVHVSVSTSRHHHGIRRSAPVWFASHVPVSRRRGCRRSGAAIDRTLAPAPIFGDARGGVDSQQPRPQECEGYANAQSQRDGASIPAPCGDSPLTRLGRLAVCTSWSVK